jgi:hypothetical protein
MTRLMETALAEASKLSDELQDSLAAVILQEIDSERRWDELFGRPQSQTLLDRLADQAIAAHRAGRTRKLGLNQP